MPNLGLRILLGFQNQIRNPQLEVVKITFTNVIYISARSAGWWSSNCGVRVNRATTTKVFSLPIICRNRGVRFSYQNHGSIGLFFRKDLTGCLTFLGLRHRPKDKSLSGEDTGIDAENLEFAINSLESFSLHSSRLVLVDCSYYWAGSDHFLFPNLQPNPPLPLPPRANISQIEETDLANKFIPLFATVSTLRSSGIPINGPTDCIAVTTWTWI